MIYSAALISFNGSTLNSRQYPTQGYKEALVAQIFMGRERFYPGEETKGVQINKEHHSWLQLSYMKEKYHTMSEHWVLGCVFKSFVRFQELFRELYGDYDASR